MAISKTTANSALYLRRRVANKAFIVLSLGAAVFGLVWLTFILWELLQNGVSALGPHLFTESTPPPGTPPALPLKVDLVIVTVPVPLFHSAPPLPAPLCPLKMFKFEISTSVAVETSKTR